MLFPAQPLPAQDEGSFSLAQELTFLERSFNLPESAPSLPLLNRIENIEMAVAGAPGTGTLLERINILKQRSALIKSLKESQIAVLSPSPNSYKLEFFRAQAKTYNSPRATDDYLEAILTASKHKVFKFEKQPITFALDDQADELYETASLKAFELWHLKSNQFLVFQKTPINQARIKIKFAHLGLKAKVNGSPLGAHTVTKWKKNKSITRTALNTLVGLPPAQAQNGSITYKVPPQIIEVNLDLIESREPYVRLTLTRNIIAHEIGHALGLLGHSSNRQDLMFTDTDELSRISDRDLNTLFRLYQQRADVAL